jgi:Thymidylate synthase
VRNVNVAFKEAFWFMKMQGISENSRNGEVVVAPGPLITEYLHPTERVLFNPVRDANAVFHLMEAIWMLAGQRDVTWLLPFNSRMQDYTDDGKHQHGAYGHRWRAAFGHDQILDAIAELQENPESRRVVIAMWNPATDQFMPFKDVPCNTHIYFDCRGGALNMTVCNRSNDMIWGAYGANAVHMSILQEVVAWGIQKPVGVYRQMSNNFHIYKSNPCMSYLQQPPWEDYDYYRLGEPAPLFENSETVYDFLSDCEWFVRERHFIPHNKFLREIALPLRELYLARKLGAKDTREQIKALPVCDWTAAFDQWVERREK